MADVAGWLGGFLLATIVWIILVWAVFYRK
jgi:hypothetical protein